MSQARRTGWTLEDFLAWEVREELRYEFDGMEPSAMVGARIAHHRIIDRGQNALREHLRGRCEVFRESVKFRTARDTIRYPDLMVVCNPVADDAAYVTDPVVVFEVLSENSRTDRVEKSIEYQATPAVQRYVLLEQERPGATVYYRENERWMFAILGGRETMLELPEIGVSLPLGAFYPEERAEEEGLPA